MPEPSCPAGSSPQAGAPAIYYVTDADYEAAWGDWWRLLKPWFQWNPNQPRIVEDLCAEPPSGIFDITLENMILALRGDYQERFNIFEIIQRRLEWHLWNTYCECDAATMAPGADCYDAQVLALNPYAYFKHTESSGTTAQEEVANRDASYLNNFLLGGNGPFTGRQAVAYGSTNGYSVHGPFTPPAQHWAIVAWIHPTAYHTSPGNIHRIAMLEGGNDAGNNSNVSMYLQATNSVTATLRGSVGRSGIGSQEAVGPTIALNTWTHVAVSYDADNALRLYVNGAVVHSPVFSPGGNIDNGPNGYMQDGVWRLNGDHGYWGRIYGVSYHSPLTAAEIATLYAAGISECELGDPPSPIEDPETPELPPEIPAPPALDCDEAELCATLEHLRLELASVKELVLVTQRQAAPFGYQLDETWVASGSGTRTVRGLIALSADPTTIPVYKGQRGSAVKDYFELGFIAQGTADGWVERTVLRHDPQLLHIRGDSTRIGWDLAGGVAVTFKSYRRLM